MNEVQTAQAVSTEEVVSQLTSQEQKVSDLVAQGLSNREVGEKLQITEKTVKFHLTNVYKKLGINRYQLIANRPATVASDLNV